MMAKQKVVCIVGPTASGKSALAVDLARRFNGEVISADSRQVYHGLDIGTGKITRREMKGVRHHLLDVASPKKIFTAQRFLTLGREAIAAISARGKIPIICGGTGFYIDALLGRVELPDVPPNKKLRTRLTDKAPAELFELLKSRDPARARTIDRHNKRRLIRALEVALHIQGLPSNNASTRSTRVTLVHEYDVLWLGLSLPPERLRIRINTRLTERLKRGMIAEARRLHAAGISYKRIHELGLEYRSLSRFLRKEISRNELEQELRPAIWQYAKRQMTYWRRNKDITWFAPGENKSIVCSVRDWLYAGPQGFEP